MNLDDYVNAKVDSVARWTNDGLRDAVILMVKEAMRDQRHGCTEAVLEKCERWMMHGDYVIELNRVEQVILNAEPKEI